MPRSLPDPTLVHPIRRPDGRPLEGTVFLKNVIDQPNFSVGDYTYASAFDPPQNWAARLAPYLFPFGQETLRIGKFCQIADGVRFITSGANHEAQGISSFPFAIFNADCRSGYQPDTRDTVIGHDCWFGFGAIVCPGAQIGNGVIVGAGAVVRGAVPDYAVITGNPSSVVKMRFARDRIDRLLELAWWDWPADRIAAAQAAIVGADVDALGQFAP